MIGHCNYLLTYLLSKHTAWRASTYQRAVFDLMTLAVTQLADRRHVLDTVATDAAAAAAAVARGVNERQAH